MSDHARLVEAHQYWAQYQIRIAFERPTEVVGTVEALRETRNKPADPWTPRLAIRQDDGVVAIVDAYPARLLAELVLAKPAVGDRIRIRYLGEDERAAPGMSPVKRFTVDVRRAESRSPGTGADSVGGSAESENGKSGTGT